MRGPAFLRRRWVRVALVVVALALAAAAQTACGTIRAGRMLRDALEPPPDLAAGVDTSREIVPTARGDVSVIVLRPRDESPPYPAVVLVHGAVDAGADEPRLLGLGRALASRGAVVAVPHLGALAGFRLDGDDPERIAAVSAWLAGGPLAEDGRTALLGISVGGSYALVAASRPEVRDRVSAIFCFGAYADLEPLLLGWMTERRPRGPGMFDPLTEGRRLVLVGNADRLVEPEAREETRRRLGAVLRGEHVESGDLPPVAREVVATAVSTEPLDAASARRLVARLSDELARLSPARAADVPAAPVFLLHGADDPVVPSRELGVLRDALAARGAHVRGHSTTVFGHVDAGERLGIVRAWPLLRFVAAFLDDARL